MGELATAVKYELDVKVVVISNNSLGQIKWEQMVFLGNPEYGCELQPIDFAAVARGFGIPGFTIEDPAQCARHPARGLGDAGAGGDQRDRRPARAADAAQGHAGADGTPRRIAGARHAGANEDRAHGGIECGA